MRKIHAVVLSGFALLTLVAFSPAKLSATESMDDMSQMVAAAKTPADHSKLASQYADEAAKARAAAAMHQKMAEAYRKGGGSLVGKIHLDQHCDALASSYTAAAKEYDALAMAEREVAKATK